MLAAPVDYIAIESRQLLWVRACENHHHHHHLYALAETPNIYLQDHSTKPPLAYLLATMSIVPERGVLRKLYQDAVTEIEYTSSAFWQVFLQREFYEDKYIVVCEFSPDTSRRRVDIVVREYNQNQHTLSTLIFHECKRPNGDCKVAEEQALSAATSAITRDRLEKIYALTTVGTQFRSWVVYANDLRLVPLHGPNTAADRGQYIDAGSAEAAIILETIDMVKNYPPFRVAPVVPSHTPVDFDMLQDEQAGQGESTGFPDAAASMADTYHVNYDTSMQQYQQPSQQPIDTGVPSSSTLSYPQLWQPADAVESSSSAQPDPQQWQPDVEDNEARRAAGDPPVQVKVRHEPHNFHRDEYVFKNINRKTRKTTKVDWSQIKHNGKKVWACRVHKVTYIADIEIK